MSALVAAMFCCSAGFSKSARRAAAMNTTIMDMAVIILVVASMLHISIASLALTCASFHGQPERGRGTLVSVTWACSKHYKTFLVRLSAL